MELCIVFFYNKQTPTACGYKPFPIVTILVGRTDSLGLFQNDSLLPPCVARGFSSGLHCENLGALEGELTKVRRCLPKSRPSGVADSQICSHWASSIFSVTVCSPAQHSFPWRFLLLGVWSGNLWFPVCTCHGAAACPVEASPLMELRIVGLQFV